jgi:hypothetical protein
MSLLSRLFRPMPNLVGLLRASITMSEQNDCHIAFQPLHPKLQSPEYIRLALHYYAKILFIVVPGTNDMLSAYMLKGMVDKLVASGLTKELNLFEVVDIADVTRLVASPPTDRPRKLVLTLCFVDIPNRIITTEMPRAIYQQQVVFSVIALLQAIIHILDAVEVQILDKALGAMNAAYDSAVSFSDFQNLARVPNQAYLNAIAGGGPLQTKR